MQLFDLASEGGEEGGLRGLQEGEGGDPGEDLVSHIQFSGGRWEEGSLRGLREGETGEPGEDQVNHIQLFDLASEGGEGGSHGGLKEGEAG